MNAIGHNQPSDPFQLVSESIEDLLLEANNHLDGKGIENEEQEQAVASILTRLRREAKGADDMRKAERKPHDEAAKAVQAKWMPLLDRANLAVDTAKSAIRAYLLKKEEVQRAAAEAARQEAARQAEAAAQAAASASETDLAGQTTVRVLKENAADLLKQAERIERRPVQAKGGERAISLRPRIVATITDRREVLKHYMANSPAELEAWLQEQVEKDARAGRRNIPGVTYNEEKVAA